MKQIAYLMLAVFLALPLTAVADDELETESFVSVRAYTVSDALDYVPLPANFMDEIRNYEGFRGYFNLFVDDKIAAVHLWTTEEQALQSNERAYVVLSEQNPSLLHHPPRFIVGASAVSFVDVPDDMADEYLHLYASLRIYQGFTDAQADAYVTLIEQVFQPLIRETEGVFAYYVIRDSADTIVTVSIFQEQVRDVAAGYLSAFLPGSVSVVSGPLRFAVLAGVNDAANLIELHNP